MDEKKKSYVAEPELPAELQPRYQAILQVLVGDLTVSEAARRLGLSRNHFQTLMHRGLQGMLNALLPKPSGRPAKAPREAELEAEVARLRKENERLRGRVETIDRLLGVASGMLRGRIQPTGRAAKTKKTEEPEGGESEDPDVEQRMRAADEMRSLGLTSALAAAVAGMSAATLRRWRRRLVLGLPARRRRGPAHRAPAPEQRARVEALVREMEGLVGAEPLRRSVPGVSRREAAAIKRATVTTMERERVQQAERIVITRPGVVRGFDAMHIATTDTRRYALIAADASVPYRTSALVAERYDGPSVAAALDADFRQHGAPLVVRLDRAKSHDTPEVAGVLRARGVLVLHGPPHHPRYYGQLERQNREHRAWLNAVGLLDPDALPPEIERMVRGLNCLLPRATLEWRTAAAAWQDRPPLAEDRDALRDEVQDRAARIRRQATVRGATADSAERWAIEAALSRRGYLRREAGGWC